MQASIIAVVLLPLVLALGDIVPVRPCIQNLPVPREVRVVNCTSVPCPVRRGQDVNAEVDFEALYGATALKARVIPRALGVVLPYEFPEKYARACDWLINSSCPISEGSQVTYNLKMPIRRMTPPIRLNVELSMVDEKDRVLFCFVVALRVV